MLQRVGGLFGYALEARDGRLGKVKDLYFDDHAWRVRYLVAETGGWLNRNAVLISPWALDAPDAATKSFPVKLTQSQVKDSPPVDTDKPVSRQMEEEMGLYYGWPLYWLGGAESYIASMAMPVAVGNGAATTEVPRSGDPHLRSVQEVTGYDVCVLQEDEPVGEVIDFLLDDQDWTLRYTVVRPKENDTVEWILNPWWTRKIDWAQRRMDFDLTGKEIWNSPPRKPEALVDREAEDALYRHYQRPQYW